MPTKSIIFIIFILVSISIFSIGLFYDFNFSAIASELLKDCRHEGILQEATEGSLADDKTAFGPVERFFVSNKTQNEAFYTLPLEESKPLPVRNSKVDDIDINAKAAIVLDVATDKILYSKNIDETLPIASLTKLMTALIILEEAHLNDVVTVNKEAVDIEGKKINLVPKEKITVKNLLYALLISSSNDAAVALAEHISNNFNGRWFHSSEEVPWNQSMISQTNPQICESHSEFRQRAQTMEPTVKTESISKFIELMNQKAQFIGLRNTHFSNPTGLDPVRNVPRSLPRSDYNINKSYGESLDSKQISNGIDQKGNYSTVYDLAHLTKYVLKRPLIWEILRIQETDVSSFDGKIIHHLENTNQLLGKLPNIAGGKTGYTDKAGECLILVVGDKVNNHQIISVVLNAQNRFTETEKIVKWTFKAYSWQ